MAGFTNSFGAGGYDFWLMRTDSNGDSLWSRTFGGEGSEMCSSIIQTEDDGFALAGGTNSFGAGSGDFWLVRTDSAGDSLWSHTLGGNMDEYCYSIIQTADGGFGLAGYTWSFGEGSSDFWLVKTTPDPVKVSNDPFFHYPISFGLLEPFPNPFNSSVSLGFRTTSPGIYALDLVDNSGRRFGVITDGYFSAGENRMMLNSTDWKSVPSAGNYWVRLTDAKGMQDIKPIVLVK